MFSLISWQNNGNIVTQSYRAFDMAASCIFSKHCLLEDSAFLFFISNLAI